MDRLLELFCFVDDAVSVIRAELAKSCLPGPKPSAQSRLHPSELITLLILFHSSNCRTFKSFYRDVALKYLRVDFPRLVSYSRFVELVPGTLPYLAFILESLFGDCTGLSFVDSTSLHVCKFKRAYGNRVFRGLAAYGRSSMGSFFGFKLHLIVSHEGEILGVRLTPGNTDDRVPVPSLVKELFGKLIGDKGYIGAAFAARIRASVEMVTALRKNMKGRLVILEDSEFLKARGIVETVIGQLKLCCQIEHSRHRSPTNFMCNLLAGLIAYCLKPNKPKVGFDFAFHGAQASSA